MHRVSAAYWIALFTYVPLLLIYLFMIMVFAMGSSTTAKFPLIVGIFCLIVAVHIALLISFAFIKRRKAKIGVGVLNLLLLAASFIATLLNALKMELDITGLLQHGIVMFACLVLIAETFMKLKTVIRLRKI